MHLSLSHSEGQINWKQVDLLLSWLASYWSQWNKCLVDVKPLSFLFKVIEITWDSCQ